jgi:hypothetical protein
MAHCYGITTCSDHYTEGPIIFEKQNLVMSVLVMAQYVIGAYHHLVELRRLLFIAGIFILHMTAFV